MEPMGDGVSLEMLVITFNVAFILAAWPGMADIMLGNGVLCSFVITHSL